MSWWRRNRVWLALIPFAATAMVAASAYRVHDFWWLLGLHHRVAEGSAGKPLDVTLDYDDALGATSRSFTVTVVGVRRTARVPVDDVDQDTAPAPDGTTGVRTTLHFEADPDQSLIYCRMAIVDSDGRRYELDDDSAQSSPCVPFEHPGPQLPIVDTQTRDVKPGEARPPTWTVSPIFVVPQGRTITKVLLWWDFPDYVELAVPD